jgi:hypothetical protein
MSKLSWNQPCCERCWIEAEGQWEVEATNDGGIHELVSIRSPVRLNQTAHDSTIEQCAWCGKPTIVGIYKRADPRAVPYPATEREEA